MLRIRLCVSAVLVLMLSLSGCGLFFTDISKYRDPAPRISNLTITPEVISAHSKSAVNISFDYYDPNGDVDINSTLVFHFDSALPIQPDLKAKPDQVKQSDDHTTGQITQTLHFDLLGIRSSGEVSIQVFLYDWRQNQSNSLQATIQILGSSTTTFVGVCQIWFVDQPEGKPVNQITMGREVFLKVQDFSLGVLTPDVLYAELDSPSAGWSVKIPLYRTSDPTIYTSRTGPRLGVDAPAQSEQTLVAFYRGYTDRQQICLAQAKID
ncbi:hypothetical protein HY229_01690 [Candidatus Acetothermia bacterium]|nr:hypothetical protein [Candidatus Acetothermia bacterium]MBI3642802.1 hypothetical protein [Candidatus Acetothermia bacterium]